MNDHRIDCRACKGSGVTYFGQECTCNQRDCWHGSLARSCELCERDDDIEDRDKTIQALTAERDSLQIELAQAVEHRDNAERRANECLMHEQAAHAGLRQKVAERDQLAAQARQHMLDAGRWEQDASHWRATADELAAQVAALVEAWDHDTRHDGTAGWCKANQCFHCTSVANLPAAAAVFLAAKRVADALYHSERVYFASDSVLSQEFEEYRKALAGEG